MFIVLSSNTKSVYWVMKCRGVLHTPLPYPRGCSSFYPVTQHADVVLCGLMGVLVCGEGEVLFEAGEESFAVLEKLLKRRCIGVDCDLEG